MASKETSAMNKFLCICYLLTAFPLWCMGQEKVYSRADIEADLSCLKFSLLKSHPNLEIYTEKDEFEIFFRQLDIPDSLSESEAYALIASSNQVIRDGHTLFFPSQKWIEKSRENGKFLPIQPYWDGEKLYLQKVYGSYESLEEGAEIISLNGVNAQELIKDMLSKMMREGFSYQYPVWVLNHYFYEYYSYFYGCSKSYTLELGSGGEIHSYEFNGLAKSELLQKITATERNQEKGISLKLDRENQWALLNIRDWHKDVLKKVYQQNFKKRDQTGYSANRGKWNRAFNH